MENRVVVKLENGKNLKDRTIKRGYLRNEELNNFMIIHSMSQLISGHRKVEDRMFSKDGAMWDDWVNKGIMTKEQRKNLKTGFTFLRKWVDDVFKNNLDIKTKDLIVKKNSRWSFRLMDDYSLQRIRDMMENANEVNLSTDEFYDLVETKMEKCCQGCTKNRCDCETHTFFESKLVPPVSRKEDAPNCEYAY